MPVACRDVHDTEFIENATVEPQGCDFPDFSPMNLPPAGHALEPQAPPQGPPASPSEPPPAMAPQHPGTSGHAHPSLPPEPLAAGGSPVCQSKGGTSRDAASFSQVDSRQPLLPQKPSGTPAVQDSSPPRNAYRHGPSAGAASDAAAPVGQPQWPVPEAATPNASAQPHGEVGLIKALDQCADKGTRLFDRYVVRGAQDRRFGGQGVVQFAQDPHTQEQCAPNRFQPLYRCPS